MHKFLLMQYLLKDLSAVIAITSVIQQNIKKEKIKQCACSHSSIVITLLLCGLHWFRKVTVSSKLCNKTDDKSNQNPTPGKGL